MAKAKEQTFKGTDFFDDDENLVPFTPEQIKKLKERLEKYGYHYESENKYGQIFVHKEYGEILLTSEGVYSSTRYGSDSIFEVRMMFSELTDTGEFKKYDPQVVGKRNNTDSLKGVYMPRLFCFLFRGISNEEPKHPIRDKYRDREYFSKQIQRNIKLELITQESIEEAEIKGEERPFLYWSLSRNYMLRLNIMYSIGKEIKELQDIYTQSFNYFIRGFDVENPTYADVLERVSLGVLLDIPEELFNPLIDYVKRLDEQAKSNRWPPDDLLWFMLNSRIKDDEKQNYAERLSFPKTYRGLYNVSKARDKEEAKKRLTVYIGKWYQLNKDAPWYNTHLRDNGYSGYWAWEIAAVAKIMQIDDSHLKDNSYYPYDMVHWKKHV